MQEVLACLKGLAAQLASSSAWLQPLAHRAMYAHLQNFVQITTTGMLKPSVPAKVGSTFPDVGNIMSRLCCANPSLYSQYMTWMPGARVPPAAPHRNGQLGGGAVAATEAAFALPGYYRRASHPLPAGPLQALWCRLSWRRQRLLPGLAHLQGRRDAARRARWPHADRGAAFIRYARLMWHAQSAFLLVGPYRLHYRLYFVATAIIEIRRTTCQGSKEIGRKKGRLAIRCCRTMLSG